MNLNLKLPLSVLFIVANSVISAVKNYVGSDGTKRT